VFPSHFLKTLLSPLAFVLSITHFFCRLQFAVYREDVYGKLQLEFIQANDIDFLQLAQKHILQLVTFIQQKEQIS
jgi:hypothetical protein